MPTRVECHLAQEPPPIYVEVDHELDAARTESTQVERLPRDGGEPLPHIFAQVRVVPLVEVRQQVVLRLEARVERARGTLRSLRDVSDRDLLERLLLKQRRGGLDDALEGVAGPGLERWALEHAVAARVPSKLEHCSNL